MARTTLSGPVKSDNGFETEGLVIFADLPTTNPGVAGQLWNDNGTLKVSEAAPPPGQAIVGSFIVGKADSIDLYGASIDGQPPSFGTLSNQTPAGIMREFSESTSFPGQTVINVNVGTFGDFVVANNNFDPNINGFTSMQVTMNGVTEVVPFYTGVPPGVPYISAFINSTAFNLAGSLGQTVSFTIVPV